MNLVLILSVFIGGGIGSVARHYTILGGAALFGEGFPHGTLIVNVLGSFIIGVLMESFALKFQAPVEMRALLVTGLIGGFTTFSTFAFDVFKLAETGHALSAAAYVAASVFLSLLAVYAGVFLMRGVLS